MLLAISACTLAQLRLWLLLLVPRLPARLHRLRLLSFMPAGNLLLRLAVLVVLLLSLLLPAHPSSLLALSFCLRYSVSVCSNDSTASQVTTQHNTHKAF